MKFLITETQEEQIRERLEKVLTSYFSEMDSVCKFKVYINDSEDYQLTDNRFDVYIVFKKSYVKKFNHLGQANLSTNAIRKVSSFIKENFPFKCFVGTYSEEC